MTTSYIAISAGGAALVVASLIALGVRAVSRRRALRQRLVAVATRLGEDPALVERISTEAAIARLEHAADNAGTTVAEASSDAIRLRRALDSMPQGVVVCNDAGEIVFRNSRAVALMGSRYSDALASQVVDELLSARSATGPSGAPALETGPSERTLELYGPPRRTLTVSTCTIDDGQRPLGTIAVIDDVSERRRLEEVRRDFVANVSHELKTPAGALGLLAETLMSETDPDVTHRLATRIHNEAFRVSRIIDDLLDLSRIEAEAAPPRELVLVNLIMAEAWERARPVAEQQGVRIDFVEPSPPVAVLGDRRQLVSALYNLLENAIKYSDPGSLVECKGEATGDEVALTVRDHGIGLPSRDLERIFERFYRVDQGRSRHTGGTGLGLSIVRHVVNNHHGTVTVESREGEGSTFTLKLPLHAGGK